VFVDGIGIPVNFGQAAKEQFVMIRTIPRDSLAHETISAWCLVLFCCFYPFASVLSVRKEPQVPEGITGLPRRSRRELKHRVLMSRDSVIVAETVLRIGLAFSIPDTFAISIAV
jgi:hypothetical protein